MVMPSKLEELACKTNAGALSSALLLVAIKPVTACSRVYRRHHPVTLIVGAGRCACHTS